MYDVAIVGAGPAGVGVAYFLKDLALDVTVLEAEDEIGGRTRSVSVGGASSNTGALFVYRGTPAEELVTELDVPTQAFTPGTYGIHLNGVTVVDDDNDRLIDRLPLSEIGREQLRAFIHQSLEEYTTYTRDGQLTVAAGGLGDTTLADRLLGLEPEVAAIITAAIKGGSVADPGDLSVQYALRYFASYLAHEQHNRLYPVTGMQSIPQKMAGRLPPGTVRLQHRVDQVVHDPTMDCYVVTLAGGLAPVHARQVVLAVPAPVTLRIAPDLPDWKQDALVQARMPGSTTFCVTADITGLPHIAEWAFTAVTDRVFDAIINPSPVPPRSGVSRTTVQLVCYGNTAGYRPDMIADSSAAAAWLDDLYMVVPELRGRILGTHLQTWQYCFAILTPQRSQALAHLQEPVGTMHFAGDHTSASAGTHGAYTEARRVAEAIAQSLSHHHHHADDSPSANPREDQQK